MEAGRSRPATSMNGSIRALTGSKAAARSSGPAGRGRAPELVAGSPRALGQGPRLGPRDAPAHRVVVREGAEPAVGSGDDVLPAHRARGARDPVRHQLGMLDEVGRGVDDAGD